MATKKYASEYEEDLDRLSGQLNGTMDWEVRLAALQALENLVQTGEKRPSDIQGRNNHYSVRGTFRTYLAD